MAVDLSAMAAAFLYGLDCGLEDGGVLGGTGGADDFFNLFANVLMRAMYRLCMQLIR